MYYLRYQKLQSDKCGKNDPHWAETARKIPSILESSLDKLPHVSGCLIDRTASMVEKPLLKRGRGMKLRVFV